MEFACCIAGLGNPGKEYASTRHNAGFCVCDELSNRWGFSFSKKMFNAQAGFASFQNKRVLVVKPQTYMNLSGESVKSVVHYYALEPEQVLIVCDDMDTPRGNLRIRKKGGSGGHNGVESVLSSLGTKEIGRIRIGIGRPEHQDYDEISYVLGTFTKDEKKIMQSAVENACAAIEAILESGIDKAMSIFNGARTETAE